jgi:hypothetical protein
MSMDHTLEHSLVSSRKVQITLLEEALVIEHSKRQKAERVLQAIADETDARRMRLLAIEYLEAL